MTTVDLRGALLAIMSPSGQPLEVLFDFDTVDVSTWTWLGQVRASPTATAVLATFTFTNPAPTQLLATLDEADVAAIGVGGQRHYEIDQVTPTHRQMFYGRLMVTQDTARAVIP